MKSAADDLTPNVSEIISSDSEEVPDYREVYYGGLVLAFENFAKTDDLDSFVGLGYGDQIKTARELLLKEDPSKLSTIKKEFLEYGNCLINLSKIEKVLKEKFDKMDRCIMGEDFGIFLYKIYEVLYNVPNSTEPTSDSQSSS